ncbi:VOC family protein [Effusibacillus consociatus]|uniref:VOC family protein n=1 Tax=Effusibacillus consociatus TaxID=1117041 RepID=A0ABV9PZX6_9BACL
MLIKPLHVNVIVKDLDEMLDFYRNVLGFEVMVESEIANEAFCQGVGLPDASVKMAHLRLPGSDFRVEMFQYNNLVPNPQSADWLNQQGYRHIAFQVHDLEQAYQELMNQGVPFVSPPLLVTESGYAAGVRFCCLRDPEGNLIELIQRP